MKKNINHQVPYGVWEKFQTLSQKTGIKKNKLCETAILLLLEKYKEVLSDEDNKERNNNNSTDS